MYTAGQVNVCTNISTLKKKYLFTVRFKAEQEAYGVVYIKQIENGNFLKFQLAERLFIWLLTMHYQRFKRVTTMKQIQLVAREKTHNSTTLPLYLQRSFMVLSLPLNPGNKILLKPGLYPVSRLVKKPGYAGS